MSFKQYIPDIQKEWDAYWKKTSLRDELELVETDGLKPVFQKYLPRDGRILEAGCGLGKWIVSLSKVGFNIEGVDNNRYVLEKLKENFPKARVRRADVHDLPYADNTFDAYLSLGVVEHFEEGPQEALNEAYRVLKQGGIAFIEVPFDSFLRQITRILTRLIQVLKTPARRFLELTGVRNQRGPQKMRFYEYRYTQPELRNFVEEAGFSVEHIYSKDDLAPEKSVALWLDHPRLKQPGGKIFELNRLGILTKKILDYLSPFTYCALIVAVARKK